MNNKQFQIKKIHNPKLNDTNK